MKKILVTGGAGFIGSNFCNLNRERFEVVALDNLFLGDPRNLHPGVRFVEGDARNRADLERCGGDFDAVLHLAGTSSAPMFGEGNFVEGHLNSAESFLRTIEFARECGAKRFLYASTSSIYGNQEMPLNEKKPVFSTNHYSASKLFYENAATAYHGEFPEMETVGFRFMSVYGPNEEAKGRFANLISQFLWDFARGRAPVVYGDGEQSRDFTNVADIVAGISLAIDFSGDLGNQIFNIGTGRSTTVNSMLCVARKALGTPIEPIFIENPVRENYILAQHADISKISEILGYAPTVSLEEGIARQVAELRVERIRETSSDFLR